MELLDAGEMPEAVFCASDEQAFGVLKAAHEKGCAGAGGAGCGGLYRFPDEQPV